MSATAVQTAKPQLAVLGHYTVSEEARVLVGRRIEGEVYVYDYPEHGTGRRYFVEHGFESKAELAVLIADYRRQAERPRQPSPRRTRKKTAMQPTMRTRPVRRAGPRAGVS
jgi:hypothetical protein